MIFNNPIRPPVLILKNDKFGIRFGKFHNGVDLRPKSDDILASHEGVVSFSGLDQYGALWIQIDNGNQRTRYVHNRQNLVKNGQKVERGQLIGYIGSTGNSSGRHLHFETWINNQRVDPESVVNFTNQPYTKPTPPPNPIPKPSFSFDLIPKNGHVYMICQNGNGVFGNVDITRVNAGSRNGTKIVGVNRLDNDDWNNPIITNYDKISYQVKFNNVTKQIDF